MREADWQSPQERQDKTSCASFGHHRAKIAFQQCALLYAKITPRKNQACNKCAIFTTNQLYIDRQVVDFTYLFWCNALIFD